MTWPDRDCPAAYCSAGPSDPTRSPRAARSAPGRIGFGSKLTGGGEIVRDVEHAVLANRHHRRAGKIGTPDPPHQGGSGEIVRQNECGVCSDRHCGDPYGLASAWPGGIDHRSGPLDGPQDAWSLIFKCPSSLTIRLAIVTRTSSQRNMPATELIDPWQATASEREIDGYRILRSLAGSVEYWRVGSAHLQRDQRG